MNNLNYNTLYYAQPNIPINAIILTQKEYLQIQMENQKIIEEENLRNELEFERVNKIKQQYLYLQSPLPNSINQNIYIDVSESDQSARSARIDRNNQIFCIKKNELHNNYYHEPFEAFIPNKDHVIILYPRFGLKKGNIRELLNEDSYLNLCNGTLLNINVILQLFIPLLPSHIFYNEYLLTNYKQKFILDMKCARCKIQNVSRFFKRIQKICNFTLFGGISLNYYMKKYVYDEDIINRLYLKSNDYDLNVTYKKSNCGEKHTDFLFTNYIVYMIHELNVIYYKSIIDEKVKLNIQDEKCGYINIFMTFSNKDDMNRYMWLLNLTKIYKLESYISNIGYYQTENNEIPYIYKCVYKSIELNSILILKYVSNSIPNVKAIIKIETHKNQILSLEERIDQRYAPFDFIFRHDIDIKYSHYDQINHIYYNDPLFLTLVYVDLIQKYKRRCDSVSRRFHKSHKDRKRYICIVKYILIQYLIEKYYDNQLLCKMCRIIMDNDNDNDNDKYKNILVKKLLKFKTGKNIYLQMDEFHKFVLQKIDQICTKYCKHIFTNQNVLPYYYIWNRNERNIQKRESDEIKKEEEEMIEEGVYYCINDFLRTLYGIKDLEYSISDLYDDKLNKNLMLLNVKNYINMDKRKLERIKESIRIIRNDYKLLYEKMIQTKYKSKKLNDKIKYVMNQIMYIDECIIMMNKKIIECEEFELFKKSLSKVVLKRVDILRREKEKNRKEADKQKREIEELKKKKIIEEELKIEEEKRRMLLKREEELKMVQIEKQREKERIKEEKRKAIERRLLWESRKEKFLERLYYVPNQTKNLGVYIYQMGFYFYQNVSFMMILKIFGFMIILGIIGYGKYLNYQEDIMKKTLKDAEFRYKDNVRYRSFGEKRNYKFQDSYFENEMYKKQFQRKSF
jgi:hypothetical protein